MRGKNSIELDLQLKCFDPSFILTVLSSNLQHYRIVIVCIIVHTFIPFFCLYGIHPSVCFFLYLYVNKWLPGKNLKRERKKVHKNGVICLKKYFNLFG